MHFGREAKLDEVDFSLPPVERAQFSWTHCEPSTWDASPLRAGAPLWGHQSFVGKIYPPNIKRNEYLQAYARSFAAIELNSTFYATPSAERVKTWAQEVPEHFRFCPKVPRSISHDSHAPPAREYREFITAIDHFGDKLGLAWFQCPETLGPSSWRELLRRIDEMPAHLPLALELRHPKWFAKEANHAWLLEACMRRELTLICTDTAGRRDVLHELHPTKSAFVRFCGNSLVDSDYTRIRAWSQRLREWKTRGVNEIYFFVHQPEEGDCVELVECLRDELPQAGIPAVQRVRKTRQLGLFPAT